MKIMNIFANLDIIAIITATLATFAIGFLWYGPIFGKAWMKLNNVPDVKPPKDEMIKSIIAGLSNTLMLNLAVALLLMMLNSDSLGGALIFGIIMWFGISVYVTIGDLVWLKRPVAHFWINAPHNLLVILASIAIQTSM